MLQMKLLGMFMMNYIMAVLFDTDWKAEIFKRLDALSEKLGVAAGHLWGVLVRQGIAEGVQWLIWALCFGALFLVALWWFKKSYAAVKECNWNDDGAGFSTVFSFLALIGTTIGFFANLSDALMRFVNPEYFALQKILELFGK